MNKLITFPEEALPAKLTFNSELGLDDDKYYEFCVANPDLRFERTAQGEIIIVPPAGWESSFQSGEAFGQLRAWADRDGRGKAFDSSAEYILPTRAALSPDASWVSNGRIKQVAERARRKFPHACPEFVIEVMSPSDRLPAAKDKMQEWIRGGVELAWLIHGRQKTVFLYRAGQKQPQARTGIVKLAGEGPVAGFQLDLTKIWQGL